MSDNKHIFRPSDFPNFLPHIPLSSDYIKQMVSYYPLMFSSERNQEVERKLKLPMFVDSFYTYVINYHIIPNQSDAFEFYKQLNQNYFNDLNRPDLMTGIQARADRAYPSLVRDIHFNKFIEEQIGSKCLVLYNNRLDVEEGIDLMITTTKNNYGISFFTKTKNAFVGRKLKENRHIPFENVKYIDMPMDFEGSVKAGDFFLYGDKEYIELFNTLSK